MVRIKDYIETAYNAVEGICDKVYLDRPKAVGEKVSSYAIVSCPNYVSNRELGQDDFDYNITTVDIDVFVKDKVTSQKLNQMNIGKLDELTKAVLDKFPIVDKEKSVKIHNPRVIFSGSDGDGWHYAMIAARLTTYF